MTIKADGNLEAKAKYSMIKDNIQYISELNIKLKEQYDLLCRYIEELGLVNTETLDCLNDFFKCNNSKQLLSLIRKQLGLK